MFWSNPIKSNKKRGYNLKVIPQHCLNLQTWSIVEVDTKKRNKSYPVHNCLHGIPLGKHIENLCIQILLGMFYYWDMGFSGRYSEIERHDWEGQRIYLKRPSQEKLRLENSKVGGVSEEHAISP